MWNGASRLSDVCLEIYADLEVDMQETVEGVVETYQVAVYGWSIRCREQRVNDVAVESQTGGSQTSRRSKRREKHLIFNRWMSMLFSYAHNYSTVVQGQGFVLAS